MNAFLSMIMALARALYEFWVMFSSLLLFAAGGLIFTVFGTILRVILPRETGARVGRRTMHVLFRFFTGYVRMWGLVRIDLDAVAALGDSRGLIIAPNHISLCDAVFLISRLPNAVCIMKAKIWNNPVLGGGARLAGYIRNDAPAGMVKQAAAELRRGAQLLVFPEGTRTVRPPVNPFKGGCALIARHSGAAVQTVLLRTNTALLGKRDALLRRPRFPVHYEARLGARMAPADGESAKEFLRRLEDYFRAELGADHSPENARR